MKSPTGRCRRSPSGEGAGYARTLRRSGLLSEPQWDEFAAEFGDGSACPSPNEPAEWLQARGWVTAWQNRHLLEGRHRGFFVGKYRLLQYLSSGGMSKVYLAEHPLLRRQVALKLVAEPATPDRYRIDRFHREGAAAAALIHPNIVRVYDLDRHGRFHYMVMEFVAGHDLSKYVRNRGPLDFAEAADYLAQACDGLAFVHAGGMVHRDVKPSNMLLDAEGRVRLSDFGVVKVPSAEGCASLTRLQGVNIIGTVDYLPPEQFLRGHEVDGRADLYSLGCTLHYLLTGKPPFTEGTQAQRILDHQNRPAPAIEERRPDVPPGLSAICRRLMEKHPDRRWQTAAETAEVFRTWRERYLRGAERIAAPVRSLQVYAPAEAACGPAADRAPVGVARTAGVAREAGASRGAVPIVQASAEPYRVRSDCDPPAEPDDASDLELPPEIVPPPAPNWGPLPSAERREASPAERLQAGVERVLTELRGRRPVPAERVLAEWCAAAAIDDDSRTESAEFGTPDFGSAEGRASDAAAEFLRVRSSPLHQALWKFFTALVRKPKLRYRTEAAADGALWVRFECPGEPERRLGPFRAARDGFRLESQPRKAA